MLNTYIYHQLPPTCFDVCYAIFRETTALLAQKLHDFCVVVTYVTWLPQLWILTDIYKIFEVQKDEIHIVLNIVTTLEI